MFSASLGSKVYTTLSKVQNVAVTTFEYVSLVVSLLSSKTDYHFHPYSSNKMTILTLQVTEVRFDFDDLDFTPEERQAVLDDVLGNVFEVEVDDGYDDEVVADALVEEVTDYAGWCVCSLDFRHVLNTH